jgi:hypothetical protein
LISVVLQQAERDSAAFAWVQGKGHRQARHSPPSFTWVLIWWVAVARS